MKKYIRKIKQSYNGKEYNYYQVNDLEKLVLKVIRFYDGKIKEPRNLTEDLNYIINSILRDI